MTRSTRLSLFLVTITAALLLCAAFGATAFGVTGDSGDSAALLNNYFGSSLTTSLVGGTSAGAGTSYYFKVELWPGQVLKADFTPAPNVVNLKSFVDATSYNPIVAAVQVSTSLTRLTFTAPVYHMYTIYVATSGVNDAASTPGTFTVAPSVRSTVSVRLTAPLASARPNHRRSITFRGSVSPGHVARMTVTIQKKVGSRWKSYATVRVYSNASGSWSFKKKLPARTYRLRATTPAITGYYYAGTSAWRTVKVK